MLLLIILLFSCFVGSIASEEILSTTATSSTTVSNIEDSTGSSASPATITIAVSSVSSSFSSAVTTVSGSQSSESPIPSCRSTFVELPSDEVVEILTKFFPNKGDSSVHHYSVCMRKLATKSQLKKRHQQSKMKEKLKHHWLTDKDIAYSSQTRLWWLSYVEGKGMFCLLRRKHNLSNKFNKSKTFNIEPSVRYRKLTLLEHVSTQQHRNAVAAEHLQ